jgi:hypothetical protein
MKYILIALTLFLTACGESEQQRLYRQQQQIAQQQQQLNYQQQQIVQQQHQGWEPQQSSQQYQQGYAPAPIVQQPAPVIVQQPSSSGGSHVTDMLVGGLVGHAIGNAMSNRSTPSYSQPSYSQPSSVTHVTNNYTNTPRPSSARIPSSARSTFSSSRRR